MKTDVQEILNKDIYDVEIPKDLQFNMLLAGSFVYDIVSFSKSALAAKCHLSEDQLNQVLSALEKIGVEPGMDLTGYTKPIKPKRESSYPALDLAPPFADSEQDDLYDVALADNLIAYQKFLSGYSLYLLEPKTIQSILRKVKLSELAHGLSQPNIYPLKSFYLFFDDRDRNAAFSEIQTLQKGQLSTARLRQLSPPASFMFLDLVFRYVEPVVIADFPIERSSFLPDFIEELVHFLSSHTKKAPKKILSSMPLTSWITDIGDTNSFSSWLSDSLPQDADLRRFRSVDKKSLAAAKSFRQQLTYVSVQSPSSDLHDDQALFWVPNWKVLIESKKKPLRGKELEGYFLAELKRSLKRTSK